MSLNIPKSSKSLNKNLDKYGMYIKSSTNDSNPTRLKQNKLKLSIIQMNSNNKFKNAFLSSFNNPTVSKPIKIHEKAQEYERHPFRRMNLKIIGEDIKLKIKEMNEENDSFEEEKVISSPTESKKLSLLLRNKYNIPEIEETYMNLNLSSIREKKGNIKTEVHKGDSPIFEKKVEKGKGSSASQIINIKIPKLTIKNKGSNENGKVEGRKDENLENKNFSSKYRKIKKIKNLYDSMDDNESEEEVEGNIINPETQFILIFDLLIIIAYLYTFFILTFNIAQTECFCSYNKFNFNDIMFYLNDILYIFDFVISFFRGYYNYEYKLIKINKLIIKNYLTRDFTLDLLEAIPIFSIGKYICYKGKGYHDNCYTYDMPSSFFSLKIFSIFKVLKIVKILGRKKNQALDTFLELISENYAIERTTLLIIDSLIFIGIIHCFVCLHIFIGKHSYSNWLIKTNSENYSIFNLYIESLYFLVTTLTTVGYGDITCSSFSERIFQIVLLAVGSIFYSYIISTIGNYIKNDSHAKIKYNDDLNILENIRIAYPNMPFKLYKNINKYLESRTNSQEKYDVNSLIDTLPFALKNTILFTMYKSVIKNFKFFKKNDNSEFIAQVLTNFITVIPKKNEFLVYEGEMIEEIIFVKDGRISLNAAINLDDPAKSIYKYFYEKFSPFTSDEERKLFESRINENNSNKSGFVSMMNGEITYDTAKTKINNAFKTFKCKPSVDDKSAIALNNLEKIDVNDLGKFDVNGGVIRNEEGNHQYLKIIDIRKNEHFGLVFMTLKKPCPLSLQVKSKFAELYFFKKEDAICTSKNYSNIWKKLYQREFHNLRSIKNLTFKALKKYIELNQLLLDLDLGDAIAKNDLTLNDLNELEKSIFLDKSITNPNYQSKKTVNSKNKISNKDLTKFKTMNSEIDKKNQGLSIGRIFVQNQKEKISKFKGNKYSNSIIYSSSNKNKMLQWINNSTKSSSNNPLLGLKNQKSVKFADDYSISKSSKIENNFSLSKKISTSEGYMTDDFESNKKANLKTNNIKGDKLKKLKNFLIKFKKKLKIREENNSFRNNDKNHNYLSKKGILKNTKKNLFNFDTNKKITGTSYRNNLDESLIQDLKDLCNEEDSNFSFCTINNENNSKNENLSISNDINIEILSSYNNLNQMSKGKYIYDIPFQEKLNLKITKHYSNKRPNIENSLSLNSLSISSDSEKHKRKRLTGTRENKIKSNKKKSNKTSKNFIFSINNNSKNKLTSSKSNQSIFKNEVIGLKNCRSDFTFYPHSFENISEQNSIKVNVSENDNDNNDENVSPKKKPKNDSLNINIKKNKYIINQNETEYEINKTFNKNNINYKNEILNNSKNTNISYNNIYRHNNRKKIKNDNKNKKRNNNNERKIINQILGIQIPNSNIITNNITSTSSNHFDNKDNFNTNEKINNIEASFSIYNIIQKNVNKNLNIIDNNIDKKDKFIGNNLNKSFCAIY